jgi:hypothetical protein
VDANPPYDVGTAGPPPTSWRSRLLPVAAIAVTAVVTVAALLIVRPAVRAQPRYDVTISQDASRAEAVVRESPSGKVTGQVTIPSAAHSAVLLVTGAADDRSFIVGADETGPAGSVDLRLFRLDLTAAGQPGTLTELPGVMVPVWSRLQDIAVQGIALSPDGTMLAVSLRYQVPLSPDPLHYGGIEVINLATGTTWTWMSRGWYYWPGPPSWVAGNRLVAFTWWHDIGTTGPTVSVGLRQLDTTGGGLRPVPEAAG